MRIPSFGGPCQGIIGSTLEAAGLHVFMQVSRLASEARSVPRSGSALRRPESESGAAGDLQAYPPNTPNKAFMKNTAYRI